MADSAATVALDFGAARARSLTARASSASDRPNVVQDLLDTPPVSASVVRLVPPHPESDASGDDDVVLVLSRHQELTPVQKAVLDGASSRPKYIFGNRRLAPRPRPHQAVCSNRLADRVPAKRRRSRRRLPVVAASDRSGRAAAGSRSSSIPPMVRRPCRHNAGKGAQTSPAAGASGVGRAAQRDP